MLGRLRVAVVWLGSPRSPSRRRSRLPIGEREAVASTTSAVAGAPIGPVFAALGHSASRVVVTGWERTGISAFTRLAADPRTGVHLGRGRLAARPAAVEGGTPPLAEVAQVRLCEPGELPDGFGFGLWASLPLVEMSRYLRYLSGRLAAAGGQIQLRPVTTLTEAGREAPLLANCSGIGARDLVPDSSVRPVRGQQVVVAGSVALADCWAC